MRVYSAIAVFVCITLVGCGTKYVDRKPPVNAPSSDATIKLAEAADSVSASLVELAQIEKEAKPSQQKPLQDMRNQYGLQGHASVDWSGPIEELLQRLAKACHYRLRVLGHAPAIPVLINITSQDAMLADIFRNVNFMAGDKADVTLYPKQRVVELRYAKA